MSSKAFSKQELDEQTLSAAPISMPTHTANDKQEYSEKDDVYIPESSNSSAKGAQAAAVAEDSSIAPSDLNGDPQIQLYHKPPTKQFVLIIVALSLCVFLASLDQIIVSTSIPAITREYNSLNEIPWLGTAYMMTSTAFQPLYGKFSDIFGRKATMLFANFIFMIGSAISGWTRSMIMLIVGRGVAGIGAGGMIAMVFVIISDMLDMRERGKYVGFIGAVFSLSSVIGPLIGGAFADNITWRWAFWINLPIGAISVIFIAMFLNLPTPPGTLAEKFKRIDYYGSFLLLAAVMLMLLPLSWGGSKYEWSDGIIIGLLIASVVMTAVFFLVEWKLPKEPILPIHLLKIRNIWSTFGSLFFSGMAFFGIIYYMPIYFQVVKQESATIGGLETVPFALGIVITSTSSGFWVMKKGTFAFFPKLGNTIFIVGSALCLVFEKFSPRVASVFILFICGAGLGFTLQASVLAVQVAVKPKYMATVTASVQFMRSLGHVFGVAIVGTVFNNKLQGQLTKEFPQDPMILRVSQDYGAIYTYPADRIEVIYDTFIYAIHYVFYCSIAFCIFAFLCSLFIQHKELKTNENQGAGGQQLKPEMAIEMA